MSNSFAHLLSAILPQEHQWKMQLFREWEQIIGDLKDKVRIEYVKEPVLVLGVSHPAWAHELYFLSGMIKQKVNDALGEERIRTIRFQTTRMNKTTRGRKRSMYTDDMRMSGVLQVTLSVRAQETLSRIKSEELRTAVEKYYARCSTLSRGEGYGGKKTKK